MQGSSRYQARSGLNPFIVLSDVTITVLVLLACLLMLFSVCATVSAQVNRRKAQQARSIQKKQETLIGQAQQGWPQELTYLNARGLQSYLCRFPYRMFEPDRPQQLSQYGKTILRTWGERWGPRLAQLQGSETGSLIEVQVRGHCRHDAPGPWTLSTGRAVQAASILANVPGFPKHLLSVSGHAGNRRAFEPSDIAMKANRTRKLALEDRIDILLVFAGDADDDNFVAAWDGKRTYGPLNDTSQAEIITTKGRRPPPRRQPR